LVIDDLSYAAAGHGEQASDVRLSRAGVHRTHDRLIAFVPRLRSGKLGPNDVALQTLQFIHARSIAR
jgi:hypothetical protein